MNFERADLYWDTLVELLGSEYFLDSIYRYMSLGDKIEMCEFIARVSDISQENSTND